jgi:tRNA A37 methylthiotransferase MiaB
MKSVCVYFGYGCPRSMFDAERLIEYFRRNGWRITPRVREADLILAGTCGVTLAVEDSSARFVSSLRSRMRPNARLVVFGCLTGISRKTIESQGDVSILSSETASMLDELIGASTRLDQVRTPHVASGQLKHLSSFRRSRGLLATPALLVCKLLSGLICMSEPRKGAHYDIRASRGCTSECTFCAIKYHLGGLSSKPIDAVLGEFRDGLARGHRRFRLISEDVGAFGQDRGLSIVDLLRSIFESPEPFQLRLDDFHPMWLIRYFADLSELFRRNADRLLPIGLPIQSGSDRVLHLMKRGYSATELRECFLALRKDCPRMRLHTHVLIGFPTETEQDFEDTLDLLDAVRFDRIGAYTYSDRPGTPASEIRDKIPDKVKRHRLLRLWFRHPRTCRIS